MHEVLDFSVCRVDDGGGMADPSFHIVNLAMRRDIYRWSVAYVECAVQREAKARGVDSRIMWHVSLGDWEQQIARRHREQNAGSSCRANSGISQVSLAETGSAFDPERMCGAASSSSRPCVPNMVLVRLVNALSSEVEWQGKMHVYQVVGDAVSNANGFLPDAWEPPTPGQMRYRLVEAHLGRTHIKDLLSTGAVVFDVLVVKEVLLQNQRRFADPTAHLPNPR